MSDDDFDETELELDVDELEAEDLDEDAIVDDDSDDDDVDLLDDEIVIDAEPLVVGEDDVPVVTEVVEDEDDDVLDLDEELHPDDVEEPLDVLLQERTASASLEDDEEDLEEDDVDADDRVDGPTRIVPRRPGEFLCSSCFLVLPRHQLADEERMLCRDCA